MKTLTLLRHGKSDWNDAELADHERPLTPRGAEAADLVGRYLAERSYAPDLVLCSTARRAADTLDRVLAALGRSPAVERERGLYLCGRQILMQRMQDLPDSAASVLVVGHNPDLQELALALAGNADSSQFRRLSGKFPTAGLATLLFAIDRWRDAGPGSGRLVDFVKPRKLA